MDIDRALISWVAKNDGVADAIASNITTELFEGEARRVWMYCLDHFGEHGVSPGEQTLAVRFPNFETVSTTETLSVYTAVIRERRAQNIQASLIKKLHTRLSVRGANPLDNTELIQQAVLDIEGLTSSESAYMWRDRAQERITQYRNVQSKGGVDGMATRFETFNRMTGGLHDNELMLIVARQGIGKTWMETLLAFDHYAAGGRPLLFTKEMSSPQIARRIDALHFRMPYQKYRLGELDTVVEERWLEGMADLPSQFKHWGFPIIGDPDGGVQRIAAYVQRLKPTAVFVDGMYLMEDDRRGGAGWERVTHIARDLKRMSKRLGPPTVATVQFSKEGKDAADIAYGDISKEADLLWAMYQSEDDRLNKLMLGEMLKQREGPKFRINMHWDLDTMDIRELRMGEEVPEEDKDVADEIDY